jgi:ferredoxin-NADP reductase
MLPPPPFDARLVAARFLAPAVRELVFERLDGDSMAFEPGQWVSTHLPAHGDGSPPIKRSYSIASAPNGSGRFELAVTRVAGGTASTWLHGAAEGTVLPFTGPQGFFARPLEGAPPSLMIATGTGVTPLRSMILAAVAAGSQAPLWLVLGVRHEQDALYASEFRALAERHPFLRFELTLSQPATDWAGRSGYVQAHVPGLWSELVRLGGAPAHAYVCGLSPMVGSVRDLLRKELGAAREQVHSERYD